MEGLILAAGRGSRLGKFTEIVPKSLSYLPGGRFLIDDHIQRLEALGSDKIFVVVGYLGGDIETYVTHRYPRCRVVYQEVENGTAADGTLVGEQHLGGDFIVIHGDHFFSEDPFRALISCHQLGSITFLLENPVGTRSLGYGETCLFYRDNGNVRYPVEVRDEDLESHRMLLVDGCMVLPGNIFDAIHRVRGTESQPRDMKHVFDVVARESQIPMRGTEVKGWWANINDGAAYFEVVRRLRLETKKTRDKIPG